MTVITFAHHKGGTGKTTSCLSIAGCLLKSNEKLLIIDCDPQANATTGLGVDPEKQSKNMYDVFMNVFEGFPDISLKDVIIKTSSGIDLAPSSLDLVGVEPYLYSINERAFVLKEAIKPLLNEYRYILIDTPPSMGQFVINGLIAADRIVLTLDESIFAQKGLESLNYIFEDIKENTGKNKSPDMAIFTRAGTLHQRKSPMEEIKSAFKQLFSSKNPDDTEKKRQDELEAEVKKMIKEVYSVPYDPEIYRAQKEGMPVTNISPESPASQKYREISEIIKKW
ncbi:AAA family ATPase [Methanomicrobium antiquum]|uniref:AAA family ATPase n=1 Tax=Methanomicrobium antiquum TaxID=487686 RepID=A0AAF0FST3_9EURY|nr:AAA family ATPase [Methanomicrobium antiquum]WFN37982.1 AAA family ATPase [Methanomicrobium antiquum]